MAKHRVLVQAGHNPPREPGFEGGTGTVREIEFTKRVADRLVKMLDDDGRFDGIYQPGDIQNGIKVDAAIFLHGDGSASAAASGFSMGFPKGAVNKTLATLITEEFMKLPGHPPHHTDNYTGGLRGYYGYSRVDTLGPEVLVEHGFLTNVGERAWMFANIDNLAAAEYRALLRFFKLPLPTDDEWTEGEPIWQNLPGPKPKPDWFWTAVEELDRRRAL
jgi:N-acetylmuramoyl-L-alanine amidase